MVEAENSLTHLIEDANTQMNWLVKEIVKQNREQRVILAKVAELHHQIKNNLILLKDIPDRLESLVEDIKELKQ